MQKIETTTAKLRLGVALEGDQAEVSWESTGHLSVRLLDASGSVPLAGRTVTVEIPGEGTLTLETDEDGEILHLDVPFQDYELDLAGVKVAVPAVGMTSEVHERHAVAVPIGFIHAVLRDPGGAALGGETVSVAFPSGATVSAQTDDAGVLRIQQLDPGEGDVTITHESGRVVTAAAASPQKIGLLLLEAAT